MPKSESLNSQQSTKAQQSGNWWEFSGDALFSSLKQAQVVCPTRTFALKIMISRFYIWFYVCFLVTYSCPEYSGTLCTHFLTNFPESLVLGFRNWTLWHPPHPFPLFFISDLDFLPLLQGLARRSQTLAGSLQVQARIQFAETTRFRLEINDRVPPALQFATSLGSLWFQIGWGLIVLQVY